MRLIVRGVLNKAVPGNYMEQQVLEDALLITINGISQGMKNSG